MKKETLRTKKDRVSSQYAIATKAGQLIFLSGKAAMRGDGVVVGLKDLDEKARRLLSEEGHASVDSREGPIKAQTYYIYNYLKEVLEEFGCTLDDVLKQTVYLVNMNEFPLVSQVRKMFFPTNPPASSIVGVTELAPKGALIEIEFIVLKPE